MYDKRAGYFLDFPGNPNIPRCTYDRDGKRFARGKPSIAYAHIVAQPADPNAASDDGRLSLQYWFFYYFNDFNDKHEADWENIKLFFPVGTVEAALQTSPESAGYAQHEGGEYADWDSDKVEKVGTHPVVYSAVGSHASYYSSSLWLGLSSTEGFGCDDTRGPGHEVRLGAVLLPARAESRTSPFAWVNYEGRWGQKLPGANNGPTGPNMKPSWSAPFEWQEGLRGRSIHLPAGETLGQSISGAFCGTVAALSSVLNYFYDSPRWTILAVVLVLVTILALLIWLVRRSTWARAAAHPIRADRTIGQMLFASGKIYWKRRWLFFSLGLLAIVVFAAVRGFEELLQLAFSPLGDITLRFGATALAALVVSGAVAIALDRLDRDRQVTVFGVSGRVLRRALPLLAAIVLEAIVIVLIAFAVIGIPLLLGSLVEELGLAVLFVLVIIAVWFFARVLLGWAFTSQEVCVDGYSAFDVLRKSTSLVKGNWWRSVILLVILYVIAIATGPIIGFVLLFTTSLDPQVLDLIGSAIYVLLLPFVAIAATLLFFDLQERRKRAADRAAEVAISPPSPGVTA